MRSAFSGHIEEIPFVLVDNFENDLDKCAYFLSHYHGDHVCGLASHLLRARLKRNNVSIYASKVTVAIIKEECPLLAPYLKVLELGKNTIKITTDYEDIFLNVTTLPAGHSLGSVMFVFEYNKKTILYTGDFRISRNSLSKYYHLQNNGEPINLDVLYVDTTFQCVPSFPKRSDVVRNVVLHIQKWLNLCDQHRVTLLTSAGYGYEFVCNEIYKEIKLKTLVSDFHWRIYSQFPKDIYGITNDSSARIQMVTKYWYHCEANPLELVVYFSALKWGDKVNVDEEFLSVYSSNRIEVCFSTHCGRDELTHFINYFNPKKVVGFPDKFDEKQMEVSHDGFEDGFEEGFKVTAKKRKVVKETIKVTGSKVSETLLKDAFEW